MLDITILVAVITGVVSTVKIAGMDSKWAPLLALALGVVVYGFLNGYNWLNVFQGLVVGLTSSGLYSGWVKPAIRR